MSKASDYGLSDERFTPVDVDTDVMVLVTWNCDADGFVFKGSREAEEEIAKQFDFVSDTWFSGAGMQIGKTYLLLVDLSSDAYIVDMEYLSAMINSGIRITIDSIKSAESNI